MKRFVLASVCVRMASFSLIHQWIVEAKRSGVRFREVEAVGVGFFPGLEFRGKVPEVHRDAIGTAARDARSGASLRA